MKSTAPPPAPGTTPKKPLTKVLSRSIRDVDARDDRMRIERRESTMCAQNDERMSSSERRRRRHSSYPPLSVSPVTSENPRAKRLQKNISRDRLAFNGFDVTNQRRTFTSSYSYSPDLSVKPRRRRSRRFREMRKSYDGTPINLISESDEEEEKDVTGKKERADQNISSDILEETSSPIVLTYVCSDGVKKMDLRASDVARLRDGVKLNDVLIDFYFLYLSDVVKREAPDIASKLYIFSSFFYERLSDGGYNFDNVKRWTRKVNIHDFDILAIPIHGHGHWSLVLVYLGSMCYSILHLDALRMHNTKRIARRIKRYLKDAWLERKRRRSASASSSCAGDDVCASVVDLVQDSDDTTAIVERKSVDASAYMVHVPTQPNFYDCGMYVCAYASKFFEEWRAGDRGNGLRKLIRELLKKEKRLWFAQSFVTNMRTQTKARIDELIAASTTTTTTTTTDTLLIA